jgi:acetolactate synthase-1/2/3 large subunit
MRGTQAIVEILAAEGIPFVIAYPGLGNESIISALLHDEKRRIRCILPRHERVGMDLVDGYARVSGEAGVGLVCGGPGSAHAFAGVAQSFADNIPFLLLKGQVNSANLGTKSMLELPTVESFREISKWAMTVNHTTRLPEAFRRAFTALRSGKLGPVVLEIPLDVADGEIPDEQFVYRPLKKRFRCTADPNDIEEAADLLAKAREPYIVAGMGVLQSEAWHELKELAEALSVPVGTTLNGKSAFPENHPLSVGIGGYPRAAMSTPQALHFAKKADVVLAVGNSFMSASSQGPIPDGVKLIHINIDPTESNKFRQPDVVLVGDAKLVLKDLLRALEERLGVRKGIDMEKIDKIKELKEAWQASWKDKVTSEGKPINPYRVTWEIMKIVDRENTILLHDSGLARWYVSYIYESTAPRTYLGMGGQSEMGWSLGAALGAKLARPDALVVNVMGDGAFGMTGMDMETAVRLNIPILCIIINNSSLGISKVGIRDGKTEMVDLGGDYTKIANGLGAYAERVEEPKEFVPALKRAIASTKDGQAAVLEVIIALESIMRA